jgi:hypothetical protein
MIMYVIGRRDNRGDHEQRVGASEVAGSGWWWQGRLAKKRWWGGIVIF